MVIATALAGAPNQAELVAKVEAITNLGMEGKLAFTESLQQRFAVVPLHKTHFETVGSELCEKLTEGMADLFAWLRQEDISTFIISGGFKESILPVAEKLGLDSEHVFANTVVLDDAGNVFGIDTDNVCYTDQGKAPVIEHIKNQYGLSGPVCMIGDGANDLKAYELGVADYFCGFTANVERTVIKEQAPVTADSVSELRHFLDSTVITN